MAVSLKIIQNQILGAALVELLNGQLSDETIAAIDSIKREDVSGPLNNLVGLIHGMTTQPELRESSITSLIDEIRIAAIQALEKRWEHPTALGTAWIVMYELLKDLLEGSDPDELVQGVDKEMLPEIEQVPAWAQPLIQHAQNSTKEGKELTLELLDVLEDIIKKRREQLS